jgi:NitT/TauT family transport system substrate-binding protein
MSRFRLSRRSFCLGLAATATAGTARARALPALTLYGPPAGPSITAAYMVGTGLLKDIAAEAAFKVWRSPDEMRAGLTSGTMQAVIMPTTAAANLHARGFKLRLANVLTDGLLYAVTADPAITGFADLKGRKVIVPFANDTPELVFDALAKAAGLKPGEDVQVDRAGTPVEAVQMLLAGRVDLVVVPEPSATAAIQRAASAGKVMRRAIDLQVEWGRLTGKGTSLPQAGLALSPAFLESSADLAEPLNAAFKTATAGVLAEPKEAARLAAPALDLPAPIIEASIPHCHLVARSAAEARPALEAMFAAIVRDNPKMIGGRMPEDGLYL